MRLSRSIVALLVALSLMGATQTAACSNLAGCVVAGTGTDDVNAPAPPGTSVEVTQTSGNSGPPPSVSRLCTPDMGEDCCDQEQSPASTPKRSDDFQAKTASAQAALAAAALSPPVWLSSAPSAVFDLVSQPPAVPLYTLFAALLI